MDAKKHGDVSRKEYYLCQYYEKAKRREIIVGQEMLMELENLIADLDDDRFRYDRKDALLRMDFIENCIKLTKSPYYGKPMMLLLWEKAFIEAVYSFKMRSIDSSEWVDRFQEVLLLIARKNGKTELIAAIELCELFFAPHGSDIVCSGTDDGTADLAYQTIDTMRLIIDPKSADTWRNQKGLKCLANNNHIYKLSDSTRQKEGRNIDIAGIDEVWKLPDDGIYKPIQQSTSVKDNFKIFLFGSEGFVEGFLDKKREEYTRIIYGEDTTDASLRKLPWLYTQDTEGEVWDTGSDGTAKAWMKSNPSLHAIKKASYLRDRVEEARNSKSDRMFVLTKDFNIKQNSAESWLDIRDYDYDCQFNTEDVEGCYCLGAVDLAETTDLCSAKALIMKKDDPCKYIISHFFIPETKITEDDDREAGAKYKQWAKEGHITVTEGSDVDLAIVADWFYGLFKEHKIRMWKCGYDQKFAKDWINRMKDYGWIPGNSDDADLIMVLQNAQTLSNAIKLCESDFKHQLVRYNNPVDKWCLKNAGISIDSRGQALIVKQKAKMKIDGAVTFAIVYEMYRRYRSDVKKMAERAKK